MVPCVCRNMPTVDNLNYRHHSTSEDDVLQLGVNFHQFRNARKNFAGLMVLASVFLLL